MNKKILVIGGTGLLGSSLVPFLKKNNFEVTEASRHGSETVDFTETESSHSFLKKNQPDIIINLAAHTNVDKCEKDPNAAYLLNCKIVENITDWMAESKKSHLIQISTDMVYDKAGFNKETEVSIRNHYALSKFAGELAAAKSSASVLRTNFFGKSKTASRSSITDWVYQNLEQKNQISIIDDVYFSPLSLTTICSGILCVVQNPKKGLFNLGSTTMMSKAEFCMHFAKQIMPDYLHLMTPIHLNDLNLSAVRPHNMGMDSSLFEKTFNFKLPSLEQELDNCVKEYKQNENLQ